MAGNKKSRKPSSNRQREVQAALPLAFGMSPEQAERLKRIPIDSLNRFQEKKATKIDSTNIYLRIMTGIHIVEHVMKSHNIEGDVFKPLQEALSATRATMFRNEQLPDGQWTMSPGETVLVIAGLDVVDQLQDQITRRDMLFAFRGAQRIIEENFRKAHPGKPVPKETHQQIV